MSIDMGKPSFWWEKNSEYGCIQSCEPGDKRGFSGDPMPTWSPVQTTEWEAPGPELSVMGPMGSSILSDLWLRVCKSWPPRILQARLPEWIASPFSRGSSQGRDWTCVFCIAGRLFTVWATREAQFQPNLNQLELNYFWFLKLKSFNIHYLFWWLK